MNNNIPEGYNFPNFDYTTLYPNIMKFNINMLRNKIRKITIKKIFKDEDHRI